MHLERTQVQPNAFAAAHDQSATRSRETSAQAQPRVETITHQTSGNRETTSRPRGLALDGRCHCNGRLRPASVQESLCAAVTACRRCRPRDLHAKRCAQRPVRSDKSPPAGHDRSKGHAPAKELAPPGATRRQAARSSGSPAPSADSPPTRNRNAAFACRLAANTAVGSERRTRSHDSM